MEKSTKLFVANVSSKVGRTQLLISEILKADKVDLEELFSRFGKLVDVSIKGGHNQPFAFIEFEDASSAEQAMEKYAFIDRAIFRSMS